MVSNKELEQIVVRAKNATWELENTDKMLVERIGKAIKSFSELQQALIERGSLFVIPCDNMTEKNNG